jgi:hypothetical protein
MTRQLTSTIALFAASIAALQCGSSCTGTSGTVPSGSVTSSTTSGAGAMDASGSGGAGGATSSGSGGVAANDCSDGKQGSGELCFGAMPKFQPMPLGDGFRNLKALGLFDCSGDGKRDIVLLSDGVAPKLFAKIRTGKADFSKNETESKDLIAGFQGLSLAVGPIDDKEGQDLLLGLFKSQDSSKMMTALRDPAQPCVFTAGTSVITGSSDATTVALGDLNFDKKLDSVAGLDASGSGNDALGFALNGATKLTPKTGAHYEPHSLVVAKFDKDDCPDAAYAGRFVDKIFIYKNVNCQAFGDPEKKDTGKDPRGLVGADFDMDGDIDLLAAESGVLPRQLLLFKNNGNGVFEDGLPIPYKGNITTAGPVKLVATDMDLDGDPDVVMLSQRIMAADTWALWLFINDGKGNLAVANKGPVAGTQVEGAFPVAIPSGNYDISDIAVGDVNDDDAPDVVAIEHKNTGVSNVYLLLTEP